MSETGVRTVELGKFNILDEVIGNRSGSSGSQTINSLSLQLVSDGPLAEAIAAVNSRVTTGLLAKATWSELSAIAPTEDGAGGLVLDTDTGSHLAASGSGYNGTSVGNAGFYSWNAQWSRWVRIGDTGLAGVRFDLNIVKADLNADALVRGLGVNVFDFREATTPVALKIDGTGHENYNNHYATDFIRGVPGQNFTSNYASTGYGTVGMVFYNADRTFHSGSATPLVANTPRIFPVGAHFVRLTYNESNAPKRLVMVTLGDTLPSSYREFGLNDSYLPIEVAGKLAARAVTDNRNILPDIPLTLGKYTISNGTTLDDAPFSVTSLIPVEPGGQVTLGFSNTRTDVAVQWFDYESNFITSTAGVWAKGAVFNVPATAYYLRTTIKNVDKPDGQFRRGNVVLGSHSESTPARVSDARPWHGKGFVNFGDSIQDIGNPFGVVCQKLKATQVHDCSLNGRTIARALFKKDDVTPLAQSDFDNVDLVYNGIGTNDFGLNLGTVLGTIGDAPGAATFYGGYKQWFEQLYAWKPTLRFHLQTPIFRADGNGRGHLNQHQKTIDDFADAIKELGRFYSVPVYDALNESGFNPFTMPTLSNDLLHPNTLGQGVLAANISGYLERYRPS